MPLDPQAQAYLDQLTALNTPPIHTLTPDVVREWRAQSKRSLVSRAPRLPHPGEF